MYSRYLTMSTFQWKSLYIRRDYVQIWQNHSFPSLFRKHTQGLEPRYDVILDKETSIPLVPPCCSWGTCPENVCLWEESDSEVEFGILLRKTEHFLTVSVGVRSCQVRRNFRHFLTGARKYTILCWKESFYTSENIPSLTKSPSPVFLIH